MKNERIQEKFANLLEFKRIENGFSYQDMARFLGVSYLQLHRWVNKKTTPRTDTLRDCCQKCGVDYATLLDTPPSVVSPVNIDSLCGLYAKTESTDLRYRSYLMCCSLVFKVIQSDVGDGCSLIFSDCKDPEFLDFSSFSTQAMLISSVLGKLTIIGGSQNILFKLEEKSAKEDSVLSSGFETVSSSSISRILELQKLKND